MKSHPRFFSIAIFFFSLVLFSCNAAPGKDEEQQEELKKEFCVALKFGDHTFLDEDLLELSTGDFIVCGKQDEIRPPDTRSMIEQLGDMDREIRTEQASLVMVDAAGHVKWTKEYASAGLASSFRQLIPGEGNTFYALKSNFVNIMVEGGIEILQLDYDGTILKDFKIHPREHFCANKMIRLPGGDFVIVGKRHGKMSAGDSPTFWDANDRSHSATLDQAAFSHAYAARIGADGTIKWEKENEYLRQFEQIAGGNNDVFYAAGNSEKTDEYYICGLDLNSGKLLWKSELPDMKNFIYPMTSLSGGNAAIFVNSFNEADSYDPGSVMLVYDPSGKQKLKKSLSITTDFYFSSVAGKGNEIVFSGYDDDENTLSYGVINEQGVLLKNEILKDAADLSSTAIKLKSGRFLIIQDEYDHYSSRNIQYLVSTDEKGDLPPSRDSI